MSNERNQGGDVRWLDERALHAAVLADDAEAFAELMRRYDPVVRRALGRGLGGGGDAASEAGDERVADFWCALLRDERRALRAWDGERYGLLAPWLAALAMRAGVDELRRREHARAVQAARRDRAPRATRV